MRQQHRVQQQSTAEESAEISETVETVEEEGESAAEYDAAYTGLANYGGNVWRYQVNGKIQWGYTGLVQYYGTWYYVEKGTLNWNYTGLTNYYGTWYYVEKGVLVWNYSPFNLQSISAATDKFAIIVQIQRRCLFQQV